MLRNLDARPSLYRNEGAGGAGHWLSPALEGGPSNRSAIGTRVMLQAGDWSQLQEVQGGSSYQATNDFRLHFGLGELAKSKNLIVRWRSGAVQTFEGVAANIHYRLQEGGKLEPRAIKGRRVRGRTHSSQTEDGAAGPAESDRESKNRRHSTPAWEPPSCRESSNEPVTRLEPASRNTASRIRRVRFGGGNPNDMDAINTFYIGHC